MVGQSRSDLRIIDDIAYDKMELRFNKEGEKFLAEFPDADTYSLLKFAYLATINIVIE